jgi:hypothetical protein
MITGSYDAEQHVLSVPWCSHVPAAFMSTGA